MQLCEQAGLWGARRRRSARLRSLSHGPPCHCRSGSPAPVQRQWIISHAWRQGWAPAAAAGIVVRRPGCTGRPGGPVAASGHAEARKPATLLTLLGFFALPAERLVPLGVQAVPGQVQRSAEHFGRRGGLPQGASGGVGGCRCACFLARHASSLSGTQTPPQRTRAPAASWVLQGQPGAWRPGRPQPALDPSSRQPWPAEVPGFAGPKPGSTLGLQYAATRSGAAPCEGHRRYSGRRALQAPCLPCHSAIHMQLNYRPQGS